MEMENWDIFSRTGSTWELFGIIGNVRSNEMKHFERRMKSKYVDIQSKCSEEETNTYLNICL